MFMVVNHFHIVGYFDYMVIKHGDYDMEAMP